MMFIVAEWELVIDFYERVMLNFAVDDIEMISSIVLSQE